MTVLYGDSMSTFYDTRRKTKFEAYLSIARTIAMIVVRFRDSGL